jgi:hypothetical protein
MLYVAVLDLCQMPARRREEGVRVEDLEDLISYCEEGGWVCPMSQRWNELWKMLPDRRRSGSGWVPPLILAAWDEPSDNEKRPQLREHLAWASEKGVLEEVGAFPRGLAEDAWHHEGE